MLQSAKKLHGKSPKIFYAVVAVVIIAAIAIGVTYVVRPDLFKGKMPSNEGKLVVHFVDVGQGDCIYVQFPGGKDMLIDAGTEFGTSSPTKVTEYLSGVNNDGIIDYLIVTHSDYDHIRFLADVVKNYQINAAYLPFIDVDVFGDVGQTEAEEAEFNNGIDIYTGRDSGWSTYKNLLIAVFNEPDCIVKCLIDNLTIEIEDDVSFKAYCLAAVEYTEENILKVSEVNELSPICLLTYAQRTIVFTGDAEKVSEEDFCEDAPLLLDCDVLKVGHHGSKYATTSSFLSRINVEYAVISVGADNSYGHPSAEALGRLEADGDTVYRTDKYGTITLTVDNGGNMNFGFAKAA